MDSKGALFATVIVLACITTVQLLAVTLFGVPILGATTGSSMEPTISGGAIVFILPDDITAQPSEGDIVTFRGRYIGSEPGTSSLVMHRITAETPNGYITQGDNAPQPDPEVITNEDIIGVVPETYGTVIQIPYVGAIMQAIRKHGLVILSVTVLGGLLVSRQTVRGYLSHLVESWWPYDDD